MNDQSRPWSFSKSFGWVLLPLILIATGGVSIAWERRVRHGDHGGLLK
jgi:hypothetical protein